MARQKRIYIDPIPARNPEDAACVIAVSAESRFMRLYCAKLRSGDQDIGFLFATGALHVCTTLSDDYERVHTQTIDRVILEFQNLQQLADSRIDIAEFICRFDNTPVGTDVAVIFDRAEYSSVFTFTKTGLELKQEK